MPVTIAVCLIVRDEQANLGACLSSVAAVADEIIVHDTGSVDGTVLVAQAAGARVIRGGWTDDFGAARNVALAAATADWILCIDADEIATLNVPALRARLADTGPEIDGYAVQISTRTPDARGLQAHTAVKLFRRVSGGFRRRVHERVLRPDGQPVQVLDLPAPLLQYWHAGYDDVAVAVGKARRNAHLCRLELQALLNEPTGAEPTGAQDNHELARISLDLGRSLMGCGESDAAVDALNLVRALPERDLEWAWATDLLARIALHGSADTEIAPAGPAGPAGAAGPDSPDLQRPVRDPARALELAAELAASGRAPAYSDWLRAQALGLLGEAEECYRVLNGITALHDLAGRELDYGQVLELAALAAAHSARPWTGSN